MFGIGAYLMDKEARLRLSIVDNMTRQAGPVLATMRRISSNIEHFNRTANAMRGALSMGLGYVGLREGWQATFGQSIKFEEKMADVFKVIDLNRDAAANMTRQIVDMSKVMPLAAGEIADVYAAAGQSNIPLGEIRDFAEMVAQVSTAWDSSTAETGQALAEIKAQLGLGVKDLGLYADAINELSNQSAARTPDLVDFGKRVSATGEMFGFGAQETLAFGGAMISAGAESEVAATSFRNMGKALASGARATKSQREAFRKLGLNATKTAKRMQEDAVGTTLDVIEKIQALPEWQQISIASALFGDEARALMPVIRNNRELRRQLELVGDSSKYAGSAFREYVKRAETTGSVLKILRNKFSDVGRGWSDSYLDELRAVALGIGDVLDTLGQRATVLDQAGAAWQGFMKGMGATGDLRTFVENMGDLFLGVDDGEAAADRLGRIFAKFEEWGRNIRAFSDAVAASPVTRFAADMQAMSGIGLDIVAWSAGIALAAGAISKLASALYTLSGARAGVAILTSLTGIGAGTSAAVAGMAGTGLAAETAAAGIIGTLATLGTVAGGVAAIAWAIQKYGSQVPVVPPKPNTPGDYVDRYRKSNIERHEHARRLESAGRTKDDDISSEVDPTGIQKMVREGHEGRPIVIERPLHPSLMNDNLPAPVILPPDVPPVDFSGIESQAAAAGKIIDEALNINAVPSVDPSALSTARDQAATTGQQMDAALSITATPTVNTSAFDAALAKARAIGAAMSTALRGGAGGKLPTLHYTGDSRDSSARPMGARADGGPVRRGLTYEINERGTETVTMGSNGYVTPAHRLGGGPSMVNHFNISGGDPKAAAREVGRQLARMIDRSDQLAFDDMV